MRGISAGRQDFGASWRRNDLEFIPSPRSEPPLQKNGVILTTWREIQPKFYPPALGADSRVKDQSGIL